MTARTQTSLRSLLTLGAASGAMFAAAPAVFAQDMSYEERVYEYAQPIPAGDPVLVTETVAPPQPVDFRSEPVVQPIPVQTTVQQPVRQVRYVKDRSYAPAPQTTYVEQPGYVEPVRTREVVYETQHAAPVHHAPAARHYAPPVHHAPVQQVSYAPPRYEAPAYDRDAWLDECRDRIDGRERGSNGGIIGGLLGAIAGGVIGNRVYDSERLAGTLIGAGVGGLAGLAIGSVISGSGRDRDFDECEAYLERWEYQQRHGAAYPAYGHGYTGYATHGYTYVPVTVAVPQRAIVREYVTTEVYTEHEEVVVETAPHYTPAPRPVKRQRYIKGK